MKIITVAVVMEITIDINVDENVLSGWLLNYDGLMVVNIKMFMLVRLMLMKIFFQVGDLTVSEQIVPCQDCKFVVCFKSSSLFRELQGLQVCRLISIIVFLKSSYFFQELPGLQVRRLTLFLKTNITFNIS